MDGEQFERLYRTHFADVTRYVRRRTEQDLIDDLVSDVFLTAWRRAADLPTGAELPWLYGIARRVVGNHYRGRGRRLALAERLELLERLAATTADPSEDVLRRLVVRDVLGMLPDRDQEVLRLAEWERLGTAEIAAVLDCSFGTAKVRLHRARRRFADRIADQQLPPPGTGARRPAAEHPAAEHIEVYP